MIPHSTHRCDVEHNTTHSETTTSNTCIISVKNQILEHTKKKTKTAAELKSPLRVLINNIELRPIIETVTIIVLTAGI